MNESIFRAAMKSADTVTAEKAFREIDSELASLTDACGRAALLLRKAELYGILHRFDDARKTITFALNSAPVADPDITFQSERLDALLYHEEHNLDEAFKRMTVLLQKYSQQLQLPELRFIYEDIQQRRGFELLQLLRFDEAVPIFKECLLFETTTEDRGEILSGLGTCYSHLKRFDEARDCFIQARAVGLASQSKGEVQLQLGIVYFHLHLFRESKRELKLCEQHAAELTLPMKIVYGWLSAVCGRLGQKTEAAAYARLANPS